MWEFITDTRTGACNNRKQKKQQRGCNISTLLLCTVLLLFLHVTRSTGIIRHGDSDRVGDDNHQQRTGRLVVISSRQFTPGTSGVGEAISVDAEEFERLVKEEHISVVRGGVVDGDHGHRQQQQQKQNFSSSDSGSGSGTTSTSTTTENVQSKLEQQHAGVLTDNLSSSSSSLRNDSERERVNGASSSSVVVDSDNKHENPPIVAILPEDSSRGASSTQQQAHHHHQQDNTRFVPSTIIDRRKVGQEGTATSSGNSDLSFTGILNGLLDSFINDGPPPPPKPKQNTTPSPSQQSTESQSNKHNNKHNNPNKKPQKTSEESTSLQDDEEEDEEDPDPLEDDPLLLDEEEGQESPEDPITSSTKQQSKSKSKSNSSPSSSSTQSTTEDILSTENVSEYPTEDDDNEQSDLTTKHNNVTKQCAGECRNIIFGLFLCDEIDNDAFCPEAGLACCVNNPEPEYKPYKPYGNGNTSSSEELNENVLLNEGLLGGEDEDEQQQQTHQGDEVEEEEEVEDDEVSQPPQRTQTQQQQQQQQQHLQPPHRYNYNNNNNNNRLPPPPPPQQQQSPHYNVQSQPPRNQFYYPPPHHPKNPPPNMMMHPPPRMPLPCPRYCVKNYHEGYCTDRLPSQFSCGMDGFCCSHPVNKEDIKQEEEENDEQEENPNNQDDLFRNGAVVGQAQTPEEDDEGPDVAVKKILGPCTEEVGSCVSKNIINIICFAHAIPTDMYTCPRTSMKCCARKTALPKDSLPSSTTSPPTLLQKPPDNSILTRNSSSSSSSKPLLPPPNQLQHPQILPQFAPQQPPPPPPPPHIYSPTQTQSQQQFPIQQQLHPTQPQLAETPPPPIQQQPNQFTNSNPFTTSSLSRTPTRQPVGQYVCGVKGVPTVSKKKRRRKRVVGGSDSLPGEWCWQVALINSLNQYLCGGALIGTQWVLTAAHCVTNIVRSGDAIYVRVGDHDLTSRYGSPGAQTLRVATTYIHHNHNSQTLDNDIALLKLQGNAALKEGVCLVCLPSRNHMSEIPGKRCTVTGYGYMGESGPIPLRIREANLPIVSDDECVRKVNAVTEKVFSLPQSSFCAGGDKSGNDACQGDGGGPLVCRADDPTLPDAGTGYYELTGLVSWGFGCGRESVPGVYVKVSSFIGWIHQIIRSN